MDNHMRFGGSRLRGSDVPSDGIAVYRVVVLDPVHFDPETHDRRLSWCEQHCGTIDQEWTVTWWGNQTQFTFCDQARAVQFELTHG